MTADTDTVRSLRATAEATLDVTLGKLTDAVNRLTQQEERFAQWWQDLHPAPLLPVGLTGSPAAGATIDTVDRLQVKDGYWWDVRRLSCWGFTAGSVNVFLNDASGNGELLATFPQAGQWSWSGQLLLAPRDRLVAVVATNITGSVFVAGQVIEVASPILPQYLD